MTEKKQPEVDYNLVMADNIDSYTGISRINASRTFVTDVESNIRVRSDYNVVDFEYYRDSFRADFSKIEICDKAYEKIGIIYSMINLMTDFTTQGIRIVHEDPKLQKFYRALWKKWDANSVSERFCNYMYRLGNVPVHITSGRISPKIEKEFKTYGEDIETVKVKKRNIPVRFGFIYPKQLKVINGKMGTITGKYKYGLLLSNGMLNTLNDRDNRGFLDDLPGDFVQQIKKNPNLDHFPLSEEELEVYFYKKDHWRLWAMPMVYPIVDDLQLFETMKLCDRSALDGAISNIRLWTLGDLKERIYPNQAAINKLTNVLDSATPGTLDLIWGPELKFQESNTNTHQYLKSEKYEQVVKDIYQGLGIPPSLTGGGTGTGASANGGHISMKTLIERLEYGRRQLISFWEKQLDKVQKALGHKKRAKIVFDYKVLSDGEAEKKLIMDLYDRDLISWEGICEKYGNDYEIEEARVIKENRLREKGKLPPKASPYHNPQTDHEYKKILLIQGGVVPSELGIELLERDESEEAFIDKQGKIQEKLSKTKDKENLLNKKNTPKNPEGRPKNTRDIKQRKQRITKIDTSKAGFVNTLAWATSAQKEIHDLVFPAYLKFVDKKNARQLTKSEAQTVEDMKFKVLTNIEPFSKITSEVVSNSLESGNFNKDAMYIYNALSFQFKSVNDRMPTIDEQRQIQASAYAFNFEDEQDD